VSVPGTEVSVFTPVSDPVGNAVVDELQAETRTEQSRRERTRIPTIYQTPVLTPSGPSSDRV
jgi:hypothetical protein